MAKRRYNAKKIARQPSLKKKLAELLADYDEKHKKLTLRDMLAYGHRGYISYNETELCRLFDQLYSKQLAEAEEKRKRIAEKKINPRHSWEVNEQQRSLEEIEKHLSRFKEIGDEIFEAQVLW